MLWCHANRWNQDGGLLNGTVLSLKSRTAARCPDAVAACFRLSRGSVRRSPAERTHGDFAESQRHCRNANQVEVVYARVVHAGTSPTIDKDMRYRKAMGGSNMR